MTKAKRKVGRPTKYTKALANRLCVAIASGKSLRAFCAQEKSPGMTTVLRWLADANRTDFRLQYARACELRADLYADDIIDLADSATPENVNAVRLQVDARKWIASRLLPKKYGDRLTAAVQHGVSDDLKAFFDSVANKSRGLPKDKSTDLPRLETR